MSIKPKTKIAPVIILVLGLMLAMRSIAICQDQNADTDLIIIKTFIENSDELGNYSKNGFTSQFSGNLWAITNEIQRELDNYFPEYKFQVAEMKVLIDAPTKNYRLILISQRQTGRVLGFVWANYWMIRPSKSFTAVFHGQQAKSKDDAKAQLRSFANLLTSVTGDKLGKTIVNKRRVAVEMLHGAGVFAILQLKFNRRNEFGNLTIVKPNGANLKYFV